MNTYTDSTSKNMHLLKTLLSVAGWNDPEIAALAS